MVNLSLPKTEENLRWWGVREQSFHFFRTPQPSAATTGVAEVHSIGRLRCWPQVPLLLCAEARFRIFSQARARYMSNLVEVAPPRTSKGPLPSTRKNRLPTGLFQWQVVVLLLLLA